MSRVRDGVQGESMQTRVNPSRVEVLKICSSGFGYVKVSRDHTTQRSLTVVKDRTLVDDTETNWFPKAFGTDRCRLWLRRPVLCGMRGIAAPTGAMLPAPVSHKLAKQNSKLWRAS